MRRCQPACDCLFRGVGAAAVDNQHRFAARSHGVAPLANRTRVSDLAVNGAGKRRRWGVGQGDLVAIGGCRGGHGGIVDLEHGRARAQVHQHDSDGRRGQDPCLTRRGRHALDIRPGGHGHRAVRFHGAGHLVIDQHRL